MARFSRQEFTESERKDVINNILNGKTALSLYNTGFYGMNKRTFYRRYRDEKAALGVLSVSRKHQNWEHDETYKLQKLAEAGLTPKDIEIDGRSKGAIKTKLSRDGIDVTTRTYKPWTDKEVKLLIELREQKMSAKKIVEAGFLGERTVGDIYQKLVNLKKAGVISGNKRDTENGDDK